MADGFPGVDDGIHGALFGPGRPGSDFGDLRQDLDRHAVTLLLDIEMIGGGSPADQSPVAGAGYPQAGPA